MTILFLILLVAGLLATPFIIDHYEFKEYDPNA